MSTRHERRRKAKAALADKLERLATAERARRNGEIVRANLSRPVERNYYAGIRSSVVSIVEHGALSGGFQKTRVTTKG